MRRTACAGCFPLLLLLFVIGIVSCTDDVSAPDSGFTIDAVSAETEYLITDERTIWLSGSGFLTGDVVRLTDTGLSGHYYQIETAVADTGLHFVLPGNFVAGEYAISILRGDRVFRYGKARFFRDVIPDCEGMNVKGSVCDMDGKPIVGAAVSDGVEIALTDEKGRYWLATQRQNPHLFVTLPSNYMPVEQKGRFTAFYKPIPAVADPAACVEVDFTLARVSNDDFELIVITDTHLTAASAAQAPALFADCCIPDINSYVAEVKASGRPAYLINLGDLVAANYRNRVTLEDAAELLRQIKCPIFNLPGNHELNDYVLYPDMDSEEAMTEIRRYQETMGPLYYSVNLGRAHLVVLNPCVRTAGESQMSYSVSKEQLAWLRKDLALVEDKTAPLLLAVHTPIYSYNDDTYGRFWLPNGAEVIECFREFSNIHILTGHTHRMYTSVLENGRITEHNYNTLGGTSGHWTTWRLPTLLAQRRQGINTDGSPASYGTLSFSGDRVVDYCVKGVNLPRTKRFRAYDRNAMRLSAAAYLSPELAQGPRGQAFDASMGDYAVSSSENEILVKIWEYNPEWKVEILENGRLLSVTEKKDKDPLYLLCYEIPSYETMDSPGYPAPVRKLFSAKASSATSPVTIRITDSFGRVTEETMTRPKPFVSSFD